MHDESVNRGSRALTLLSLLIAVKISRESGYHEALLVV